MKKMLVLIALLLCLAALAACAEGGALLPLDENENVSALLTDGQTLYIVGDALYTWREGDAAPRRWEDRIDLPGPEEGGWRLAFEGLTFFTDGTALRGGRLLTDADGVAEALQLCEVAFNGDGSVGAQNVRTLRAPAAMRDCGLAYLTALCAQDGTLYVLGYASDGAALCALEEGDADSARAESLKSWGDFHLLATPEGVLLSEEGFDEGTPIYRAGLDGRVEKLCDLPPFTGAVAADPETGAVFAVLDGRVRSVDLESGALGEAVSALQLFVDGAAALNGGGRYAARMGGFVSVVDAESPLDPDGVMTCAESFSAPWMDQALLRFAVAHPELALARVDARMEDALDGMLTRSQDVDVYITDTRDGAAAYWALLNRGFMLPLERESLRAFQARMYPAIQQGTARDGALCALPVDVSGWGLGVGEAALARLGLSISDVPGDWEGFLDFLEDSINPRLSDLAPGAQFTYAGLTAEGFRYHLRMAILNAWVNCAAAAGVEPDYGDARLLALLERLDGMDFTAYRLEEAGMPSDEGGEDGWSDGYGYSYGSGEVYLIQFSAPYAFGNDIVEGTPLLLGFGDDLPGTLPLNMTAAFVNPYTAHPEAALDLMEAILENLPPQTECALCPDRNEPLLRPGAEAVKAGHERALVDLRARLDAAGEKDRQALEEELSALESEMEDYERIGQWLVSPEKLEWYRAQGDRVRVAAPSWFEKDASGEAGQLLEQYTDGLISARDFLDAVNRKARMMALEAGE